MLSSGTAGRAARGGRTQEPAGNADFRTGAHLEFGPFAVATPSAGGHVVAPTVRGWINPGGYDLSVSGEAEIGKALRVARMFGIPALQATAEGSAQVDLQVAGVWAGPGNGTASGFPGPQVTGTAKLRNVRVAVRGAGGAIEIASADLQLLPDEVRVEKLSAKAAEASWTGSLDMPRGCGTPGACEVQFDLSADQIGVSELGEWVSPQTEGAAVVSGVGIERAAGIAVPRESAGFGPCNRGSAAGAGFRRRLVFPRT